ncbi:DUF2268 domain-containing putative Zn-dependent protease [Psychromonas sp. Urea-02u-13]|uniref:DUF2268 domain-containing putative Zn-dependent protease n=1 Tax=Psychromonas sp. Urea-02u-13 TaxID=2058326 RepID=UPI0012FEA5FF|nr:DUF2268 domain-containing putative Zn-dependent protease [Psychromonas sp. Urea-02u-13]
MTVQLHILNSSKKLSAIEDLINCQFKIAVDQIQNILLIENVDVVVKVGNGVLPETGFGGYSPSEDIAYITIDPDNEGLLKTFNNEFLVTLGHELHHCARHKHVGYGLTLGEALISEGLACLFETELRSNKVPIYANVLSKEQIEKFLIKAKPELLNSCYDHNAWFFGSNSIPRHTGYSVGYKLAKDCVNLFELPASKLVNKSAQACFEMLANKQE